MESKVLKKLHLAVGLVMLSAFVLTGQYMDKWHGHLQQTPDVQRLMFRSRHIYLLSASLLNISLGLYLATDLQRWRKVLQTIGSTLILVAPLVLLGAFFTEPWRIGWKFPASFYGLVMLLAGTLFHFAGHEQRSVP